MTTLDTKALRALHEAATPGPWVGDHCGLRERLTVENCVFIAAARNQLPALLDRIAKLEAVAKAAEDLVADGLSRIGYGDYPDDRALRNALAALETL